MLTPYRLKGPASQGWLGKKFGRHSNGSLREYLSEKYMYSVAGSCFFATC